MMGAPRMVVASPEHFDAVYRRLLRPLNDAFSESMWRRLFEQPWSAPGDAVGQVLLVGDEPVGYVGFVHGRLPRPDGTIERVCNLTTWVVDPEHRALAPSLILPALRMPETTITSLTNIAAVPPVLARLGFRELETAVCVLRPVPFERSRWGRVEAVFGLDAVRPLLPAWERRIADDHASLVEHLVLREAGGEHCYVAYTKERWRRIPTARVHWVTPGALVNASVSLRAALLRRGRLLLEIDRRHVHPEIPGVILRPLAVPRLFRSTRLEAPEVPNAYTEIPLLGL